MSDPHAEHRVFLAALADGEVDMVPESTREHVMTCPECSFELETHTLLGARLKAASLPRSGSEQIRSPQRSGAARFLVPLAAAAALLVVALGAHLTTSSGPDPLAAAVSVANKEPSFWSSNSADIAAWCREAYGNRVPAVAMAGLQPVGARFDSPSGIGVATVTYRLNGRPVHISWLSNNVGRPAPTEVSVNGKPAYVVRTHGITAVVTGVASEQQLETIAHEVATAE